MIILLLLCACLPTPEQETVVNRSDYTLEELINATPLPTAVIISPAETTVDSVQPYEAPSWVTERYPLGIGNAEVIFDAPVTVPFSNHCKVYEVSKGEATIDQVQSIIRAYFGETPLYSGQYTETKADYARMLQIIDEDPSAIEKQRNMEAAGEEWTMRDMIREYMEDAPIEGKAYQILDLNNVTSFPVFAHTDADDRGLRCFVYTGQAPCSLVAVGKDWMYTPNERLVFQGTYEGDPGQRRLTNVLLSRDEAIERGDAFLREAGLDWMSVSYSETRPAVWFHSLTHVEYSQGWEVRYHHSYDGVTGVNQQYSGTLAQDQYQSPWPQETIVMYVDADGVQYMEWTGMTNLEEIKENELQIMPFEEIFQRIKTRLRIENAYAEVDQAKAITVTDITLGYCVIPKKNDNARGYTVPAWIISYQVESMLGGVPFIEYCDFVLDAATGAYIRTDSLQ